jgi:hypothetical protein
VSQSEICLKHFQATGGWQKALDSSLPVARTFFQGKSHLRPAPF